MLGPNPDPSGKFSYLYFKERKHRPGTSCSVLPTMDDLAIDPRQCFLRVIDTFNRNQSGKLIPTCNKKRGVWIVNPDPNKSCPYGQFLKMSCEVMKLTGNTSVSLIVMTPHPQLNGHFTAIVAVLVKTAHDAADGSGPLH